MQGWTSTLCGAVVATAFATTAWAQAGTPGATVFRCPGPPVLYTDALTPQEARDKGCREIEGAPITVIQARPPAPPRSVNVPVDGSTAARPNDSRIDPQAQRARDSDSRRILENELRREQARLTELRAEYNNGEPERLGNERNYQKYLDRTADLKSSVTRKESDIAAIKRELSKLPAP
jgi:hypothetical protein